MMINDKPYVYADANEVKLFQKLKMQMKQSVGFRQADKYKCRESEKSRTCLKCKCIKMRTLGVPKMRMLLK